MAKSDNPKREKYKDLGYIIRYIRETKRIRQIDLAENYGFNTSLLSKNENNTRPIPIEELINYGKAFDMTIEEIINFKIPKITYANVKLEQNEENFVRERSKRVERGDKERVTGKESKFTMEREGDIVIIRIECTPSEAKKYIQKLDLLR